MNTTLQLASEQALVEFAQQFAAQYCQHAAVIYLHGELGAGKTTFVRAVLRALGVTGAIRSPTYTLVETYSAPNALPIFHLDLYRLADPEELEFIGLRDMADEPALLLVEWPDKGQGVLPTADYVITLRHVPGQPAQTRELILGAAPAN